MVKITDENIIIFIRKNGERNIDVERKMMINLVNSLKTETNQNTMVLNNGKKFMKTAYT